MGTKRRGVSFAPALALLVVGTAAPAVHGDDIYVGRFVEKVFDEVTVTDDELYGCGPRPGAPCEQLYLDLYEPTAEVGDPDVAPRPVVVFAHGGGLTGGDKKGGSGSSVWTSTELAKRGYVVASINYRLLGPNTEPTAGLPSFLSAVRTDLIQGQTDAQHDMQAAVRWFRSRADELNIDPDRIVVAGHSAGAGMALYVNYRSDDPGDSNDLDFPSHVAAAISYSGTMLEPSSIDPGEPPIKMFNAIDDTTAPYPLAWTNSCALATVLGNVCDMTTFTSGGHGLTGRDHEWMGGTVEFLCRHVVDCAGIPG